MEVFTNSVANKMRFALTDFNMLCQLIYIDDVTIKLMALIGIRKLLSIENNPPI